MTTPNSPLAFPAGSQTFASFLLPAFSSYRMYRALAPYTGTVHRHGLSLPAARVMVTRPRAQVADVCVKRLIRTLPPPTTSRGMTGSPPSMWDDCYDDLSFIPWELRDDFAFSHSLSAAKIPNMMGWTRQLTMQYKASLQCMRSSGITAVIVVTGIPLLYCLEP